MYTDALSKELSDSFHDSSEQGPISGSNQRSDVDSTEWIPMKKSLSYCLVTLLVDRTNLISCSFQ